MKKQFVFAFLFLLTVILSLSACGHVREKDIGSHEHVWGESVVTTQPTCREEGVRTYICSICGETKTEPIGKVDHTWDSGVVVTEETCMTDGLKTVTCSVCGESKDVVIPKHHSWDAGVETIPATVTAEGVMTYTCSVCGETKTETIPAKGHRVLFVDKEENEIDEQFVAPGSSATAPQAPEVEGYRFIGWDVDFTNVRSSITVHAQYVRVYCVEFVDYDGILIDTQKVDADASATAPNAPERAGYRFIGWDNTFDCVRDDIVVTAEYIKQYKVSFFDFNGELIGEYFADKGTAFNALTIIPEVGSIENYDFVGWDNPFESLDSDQTERALYNLKAYTVQFLMPDGTEIPNGTVTVMHGAAAEAPQEIPDFYYSKTTGKINAFTDWNTSFDEITKDTQVNAIYDTAYDQPVLIVEFIDRVTVSLSVQLSMQFGVYAFEFSANYNSKDSNSPPFSILDNAESDSITISGATRWLWNTFPPHNPPKNEDRLFNYTVNNNTNVFNFAWATSTLTGAMDSEVNNVCSIVFEPINNYISISDQHFHITDATVVVSFDEGETFERRDLMVYYVGVTENLM